MIAFLRGSGVARAAALVATIVFAALILIIGRTAVEPAITLEVGDPAPETFIATDRVEVVDEEATEADRQAAAEAVPDVYRTDSQATETVLDSIQAFFQDVREAAQPVVIDEDDPDSITPSTTEATTTTTTEASTTSGADTGAGEGDATTTTEETTTTSSTTTTTTLPPEPAPIDLQIQQIELAYPLFGSETIVPLVELMNDDWDRLEAGAVRLFPIVESEAVDLAEEFLLNGIRTTELDAIRSSLVADPRPIPLLRLEDQEEKALIEAAVADVVALSLQANEFKDDAATQLRRIEAQDDVEPVVVEFVPGQSIVDANQLMTAVQIQAIRDLGLAAGDTEAQSPLRALLVIAALSILLAALYLWRIGHDFWSQPKMVGLFGLLVVLAAAAARVPEMVSRDELAIGFLLPAALIGYLGANLFDARIAVVLALPMTVFTALATGDVALTLFAAAATLTPVPLVSSVASRAQLNMAVVVSAAFHIPLTMGLAWFFYSRDAVVLSGIWGFVSGIASGVVALGVLPILSTLFGITTTQTLLDLTDRNHPALRRIEDHAPGTFNHSIMVGNLADRAARAVGANPLLARAMAYYHDLGKTADPKYFVENQFGVTNPHDRLPPAESATIIRSHVSEGLRLAREFRIPPDVAQGILTHHGTSLMRFFYHKAEELYGAPEVNPSDYRHRGRKPKSKEMVIIMLADATEASTRALVQHEDPTSEKIRELVENVIAEKVEDGQLEESAVTFGELTRIKEAFVDALIGYYHTRIPYPKFPTARSGQPA